MSVQHTTEGERGWRATARSLWPGALWFGMAVLAGLWLYREGVAQLFEAWQVPEYSHGPLIPVISGYLFLRQLKHAPPNPGPVGDRWPGVGVLALSLMMALVGNLLQIEIFVAVSIIVGIAGFILVSFGWRRGRQFWPPVLHLCFMLPLPLFLYWQVSLSLQLVSSQIGVSLIQAMGVPVYLDGNIIDLGVYKLHVAEACSGLRYLFPVFSFTYIFAVLYQGSVWHKVILLLAAAPIAVLMNSLRVGIIGVMVDRFGIEYAEGFLHFFEGWVIFIFCIVLMIGLARVMQIVSRDRRSFAEVLDFDTTGLGAQAARIRDIQPSRQLIGCILVFATAAVAWSPLARPEPQEIRRDPFILFPGRIGDWTVAERRELEPEIARVLRADDYLAASLYSPEAEARVDLFVAWYRDQSSGSIHSPEVCIPAGGWEMSSIGDAEVEVSTDKGVATIPVNRAVIRRGLERQLVYYWFDQNGRRLTSDYAAKFYLAYDGVRTGRRNGALVRFLTPLERDESVEAGDRRLVAAIRDTAPSLPRFTGAELTADD